MIRPRSSQDAPADVVICGGGLAGILLARQLRRAHPDLGVTLIERTRRPLPEACHKVGESSVELGSHYLERLGLRDYLLERHIVKLGLRFFPGGGHLPLEKRTEIGPCAEPLIPSYQIDRGRFENDLRGFLADDGVELIEGAKVTEVELRPGDEPHTVTWLRDGATGSVRARWVVDATGRSALIRKQRKLTRGARHVASAAWFRIEGRVGPNDLVPPDDGYWNTRPCAEERWRSTNHFMGPGYWAWLIPLSTGHTSVGLVIHEEVHDYKSIAGLDRMRAFLAEHEPHLSRGLEGKEAKDFLCLRKYSHGVARAWSEDRWALVGEAGAFVDPLYSPGTDFIAFANSFTEEMIRTDLAGGDLKGKAGTLNAQYRALVSGTLDLFRQAAPVYGHPRAMATKVYWDNLSYWSFTCHYFTQELHRLSAAEYEPFGDVGKRFLELGNHVQGLLRAWALRAPEEPVRQFRGAPTFPSIAVDAHAACTRAMSREETLTYVRARLSQAEAIVAEIVLRTVQELGPEASAEVLAELGFERWGIRIEPERLELEALDSLTRRKTLPELAKDVERSLGAVRRHARAAEARELLYQGAPR